MVGNDDSIARLDGKFLVLVIFINFMDHLVDVLRGENSGLSSCHWVNFLSYVDTPCIGLKKGS